MQPNHKKNYASLGNTPIINLQQVSFWLKKSFAWYLTSESHFLMSWTQKKVNYILDCYENDYFYVKLNFFSNKITMQKILLR